MSTSADLLSQASAVLGGRSAHSNRIACWIARAALENAVDGMLSDEGVDAADATMRSKLTMLQVAYESEGDVSMRAGYAWSRLSQACHHHAFELSPSGTEVRHLILLVRGLGSSITQSS